MPRPNKLRVPYRTRSIILPTQWDEYLCQVARELCREGKVISVSDIIRSCVQDKYGKNLSEVGK